MEILQSPFCKTVKSGVKTFFSSARKLKLGGQWVFCHGNDPKHSHSNKGVALIKVLDRPFPCPCLDRKYVEEDEAFLIGSQETRLIYSISVKTSESKSLLSSVLTSLCLHSGFLNQILTFFFFTYFSQCIAHFITLRLHYYVYQTVVFRRSKWDKSVGRLTREMDQWDVRCSGK